MVSINAAKNFQTANNKFECREHNSCWKLKHLKLTPAGEIVLCCKLWNDLTLKLGEGRGGHDWQNICGVWSVSDPYSFFTDPDPVVDAVDQYGSGSGSNPDPIRIQGFNDQKFKKNYSWKKKFFLSKTAIYLSLGLHKVCPGYRRSLQLTKEAIQHFKTWIFFSFYGSFLPSWIRVRIPNTDPDPDPLARLNTDPIRIRIQIRIRNPGCMSSR